MNCPRKVLSEPVRFKVIIPARYGSSRLLGKPLLPIGGKPMLQHVYERARQSGADEVIVATDDERVRQCALGFNASVHMTSSDHGSGTERIAEVVAETEEPLESIIVNVQGDEPLIAPRLITQVAELLHASKQVDIATLCEPIADAKDVFDPGIVKVVRDAKDRALYFSRAPIPWDRSAFDLDRKNLPDGQTYYRHLGIYAYRASYLLEFVKLPSCRIERIESLEQLRALYNGGHILAADALEQSGPGVDTQSDLDRVRRLAGD